VQNGLSESGTRLLELYQQFWPAGKPFVSVGMRDGPMVDAILKMPLDLIRKGIKVNIQAIDAMNSKDAQIRTTTIVLQSLQQFYTQYLQLLSYAANPQLPDVIKQTAVHAAEASSLMMRHLLELYGEENYDLLLPQLQGGLNAQQQAAANIQALLQSGQAGNGGGDAQVSGPGVAGGSQAPSGVSGFPPNGTAGFGTGGQPVPQIGGQPGGNVPVAGPAANAGQVAQRVG
jgi:hypothetical protein